MKIKYYLFFAFLFLATGLFAQLLTKHDTLPKLVVGVHSNGTIRTSKDPNTYVKSYLYLIQTELHLSYYPVKKIGFGISYDYMFTKSNYIYYPPFYSYGLYLRYFSSAQIKQDILDRMLFFAEFNIKKANYQIEKKFTYPTVYEKANKTILNFPIGFQLRIWKGLYYETAFRYMIFLDGIKLISPRIGFEYHFNYQ